MEEKMKKCGRPRKKMPKNESLSNVNKMKFFEENMILWINIVLKSELTETEKLSLIKEITNGI